MSSSRRGSSRAVALDLVGDLLDAVSHVAAGVTGRLAVTQHVVLWIGPDGEHQQQRDCGDAQDRRPPLEPGTERAAQVRLGETNARVRQLALLEVHLIGRPVVRATGAVHQLGRRAQPLAQRELLVRAAGRGAQRWTGAPGGHRPGHEADGRQAKHDGGRPLQRDAARHQLHQRQRAGDRGQRNDSVADRPAEPQAAAQRPQAGEALRPKACRQGASELSIVHGAGSSMMGLASVG